MQATVKAMETLSLKKRNAALMEAVQAVDALNSWVKSPQYHQHNGNHAKRAVYWLKRCAIQSLYVAAADCDAKSGSVQQANYRCIDSFIRVYSELIGVPVACRICAGTGTFHHWNDPSDGDAGEPCRTCKGRGMTCLYFVETRVFNDWELVISWHTPAQDYFGWPESKFPRPVNCIPYATAWEPNAAGRELTPTEAATHLRVAETFFTDRPSPTFRYVGDGQYTHKPVDDFAYALYLGQTSPGVCFLCGAPGHVARPAAEDARIACLSRCGTSKPPFTWTALVCENCHRINSHFWDALTLPDYLLTPQIRQWAVRHGWNEIEKDRDEGGEK